MAEKYTNGFYIDGEEYGIASALSATYDSDGNNIAEEISALNEKMDTSELEENKQYAYTTSGWEEVNELAVKESDGTINEEKVNLVIEDLSPKEVYDKNGHLYGYTQIGDKYWMTSNYRYDDGRETGIIYNHYITNETDEQKGLLYTFSAMKDIELPEGWRIPTIKDWHDLFAEAGIEKYNVNSPDVTGAWNEENQTYNRTGSNVWAEDDHDYAGPMKILWSTEVFAESDDVFGLSFYRTGRGNAFDEINPEEEDANDQSNLWGIDTAESAVSAWNIQGIFENGVNYTNIRTRIKNAQAIRLVKDV